MALLRYCGFNTTTGVMDLERVAESTPTDAGYDWAQSNTYTRATHYADSSSPGAFHVSARTHWSGAPTVDKATIVADNSDTATFSGLPTSSVPRLLITDPAGAQTLGSITITGTYTFATNVAGTWTFELINSWEGYKTSITAAAAAADTVTVKKSAVVPQDVALATFGALLGAAWVKSATVNLGSTARCSGTFTITDAAIASTSRLLVSLAPGPWPNKGTLADEVEFAPGVTFAAVCAAGSATVYWQAPPAAALMDQVKIFYQIA